jgi:hypothetical protein
MNLISTYLFCTSGYFSSNVTGPGMVEEATEETSEYQCFPLYSLLLALGNPRLDLQYQCFPLYSLLLALGHPRLDM